jgi:pimeloyl-ACP methyl ester carboxylesterase
MRDGLPRATLSAASSNPSKEAEMPRVSANDVELNYELAGRGDPLVLVHGGWSDLNNWQPVVSGLAESFLVVAVDRRGHGRSERPADQGTRRDQEDDLAALIEGLGQGPAHVAGTSFGGSIAIGIAARRPELVRSVVAHEPPLMSLVAGDPEVRPLMEEVQGTIDTVLARVVAGDVEAAARQFVEEVALGPGAWEMLPQPLRATMVDTAPTIVAEQRDRDWANIDVAELSGIRAPVLLSQGDQSPPWFPAVVAELAQVVETATVRTYRGAGHAPHLSHPSDYLAVVTGFLSRLREPARQAPLAA